MDRLISEQAVIDAIAETIKHNESVNNLLGRILAIPSAEPTTDERKEALRELKQEYHHHQYNNSDSCYGWSTSFKQAVAVAIKCLSAQPKTGHWLFYGRLLKCSNCGYINDDILDECPNCKISMIEPQEERNKQ